MWQQLVRQVWRISTVAIFLAVGLEKLAGQIQSRLDVQELPPIPNELGLAGPFCGLLDNRLIVAGGANFPDGWPWDGGKKVWHDTVYALDLNDASNARWTALTKLPRPLAYGVTISIPEGILLIGGSDADQHYADVFLLEQRRSAIQFRALNSLPTPLANMAGVLVGDRVIVVGGTVEPGEQSASHRVFTLDLNRNGVRTLNGQWVEREPLPGPGRLLPGVAAVGDFLYVFGGAAIVPDESGKLRRSYLRDGFRRKISTMGVESDGWVPIAELPVPLVASPSPSPTIGPHHFLVVGGDDGSRVGFQPLAEHPGFNGDCIMYHSVTNTWVKIGTLDTPSVTTTVVPWKGGWLIPSGEIRPGVRTPRVTSVKLNLPSPRFGILNYLTLIGYLLAVLVIGLLAAGNVVNTNQFFRADQSIPWWAAGLSIFATMLSSITFMSIPAQGYSVGWNLFISSIYVLLTPLVVYVYVPFFRRLDVTSAYQYLELRFNVAVRLFASSQFIMFQLGRIAVVLFLPALALSTVAGINLLVSVVAVGALCIGYTLVGGMRAVIWTDAMQAIILLGGAACALVAICWGVPGGIREVISLATDQHKFFQTLRWDWDLGVATAWTIMLGSLFSNLFSYTASQDVVQRYLTTTDERTAGRAIWVNALLAPMAQALFFLIGTGLFAFYFHRPERLNPTISHDAIFPFFVVNELPVGLTGVIIAAVFAASQSTISSSLNSLATAAVTDFYRRFRPATTDRQALRVARHLTLLAGILGIGLAILLANLENLRSLWEIFLAILSLFGGSVSGLFVLGIFTTRANGTGAMIGACISLIVVSIMLVSGVLFWWYSVVGVVVCVLVGYWSSLIFPKGTDLENLTIYTLRGKEELTANHRQPDERA